MTAAMPGWAPLNSFMKTHNAWHVGLFAISLGDLAGALRLYDEAVFAADRSYSQDQVNAISLLARIEFAGGDVGDRWADLAGWLAPRAEDTTLPFLSLQYLLALAKAGNAHALTLLAAIERMAATAPAHDRKAWTGVALPAARGIAAHVAGDHNAAADHLIEALPRMAEIGGSHAQRDLFEQIHLSSLIEAGRASAAQQLLETRRRYDPDGVPLNRLLASTYADLGLPAQAAEATARAAHGPRR
jgi:thioredoxin-like negative regulator of GroEL